MKIGLVVSILAAALALGVFGGAISLTLHCYTHRIYVANLSGGELRMTISSQGRTLLEATVPEVAALLPLDAGEHYGDLRLAVQWADGRERVRDFGYLSPLAGLQRAGPHENYLFVIDASEVSPGLWLNEDRIALADSLEVAGEALRCADKRLIEIGRSAVGAR